MRRGAAARLVAVLATGLPAGVAAQSLGAATTSPAARTLSVELSSFDATLRRPQEANGAAVGQVRAAGSTVLGRWTTAASASWTRRRDRGVAWSAVSDAVDQAPFVWADSIGGAWQRDVVRLQLTGERPLGPVWSFGFFSDYMVAQGARDNDPRPLYRRLALVAGPWVGRRFGVHRVTVGVHYRRDREDQEYGFFSNQFPALFRLRGIGTFDRTQLNTAERAVLAHGGGLRVGLDIGSGTSQWLLAADGEVLGDRRRDGIADPTEGGTRTITRAGGGVARRSVGADGGWRLEAIGRAVRVDGVDPVFRAVNARIARDTGAVALLWWRGDSAQFRWQGGLSVGVRREAQRDILADAHWTATVPIATVALGRGWRWPGGRFGVGITGQWTGGGSGNASAGLGGWLFDAIAARDYAWARAAPLGAVLHITWDPVRAWLGIAGLDVTAGALQATDGPARRRHDVQVRLRWQ